MDGGWLFPGLDTVDPLNTRQLDGAIHAVAGAAHIDKHMSMHTLRPASRHTCSNRKVDICVIQVLVGHAKLENSAPYVQVTTDLLHEVTVL